jgi:hypothetical protein
MAIVAVATGTIYDQNDGKSIWATISPSLGQSQVYNKDESSVSWNPNYAATANRLTAIVNIGGADVVSTLSGKKWGTTKGGSELGSGVSYIDVSTNQDPSVATQRTYYFEGTYTDPTTLLTTLVSAQITLTVLKTGTNAVYILLSGQRVIKQAASGTRNTAELKCDLMRASGVDNTGITYKWFKYPYAVADQLDANHADVVSGAITFKKTDGTVAANPSDGVWADVKSIIIREDAVSSVGYFKVQAKDADGDIYEQTFDILDSADSYMMIPNMPDGNVMQASAGSKRLIPIVWYGSSQVDISNYSFTWGLNDRYGNKSGYIDTTRSPAARTISAHTTGSTAVFTVNSGTIPVAGDVIRVISADKVTIRSFEVASATATTITIRAPQNGFSSDYPTTNLFVGGTLWIYNGNGAAAGLKTTTGSAAFSITADDIDGNGNWVCQVINPLAT